MCKSTTHNRWYYRCRDCLTVAACNGRLTNGGKCGACEGELEEMGQVKGVRLVRTVDECPCDHRCTGATGPNCDCSCGGENHGTGAVVPVDYGAGPVPVLMIVAKSEAVARANEWRSAVEPLRAERDAIQARRGGGWIPDSAYGRLRELCRLIARAESLKTHTGRMKVLRSLMPA